MNELEIKTKAKNQLIKLELDALHIGDVKSAYVPFDTLGKIMVGKIPMSALCGNVLVVSDVGLLVAIRYRLKGLELDTSNVTFLCHTEKLRVYAQSLGIKTWFAPYNELDAFFCEGRVRLDDGELYSLKEKDMKTFDVCVGNPPFQPDTKETEGGSGSRNKIWHKFIEKAFELISQDGHMLFVTPCGWRSGNLRKKACHLKAQTLIWKNSIKWNISTRNPVDYFPSIGYSCAIDAWHIKVGEQYDGIPEILQKLQILPDDRSTITIFAKFFQRCMTEKDIIPFDGFMGQRNYVGILYKKSVGDNEHPYKVANTSSQVRKGFFNWTSYEPPNFQSRKVIVSDTGDLGPWYDDGKCGTGDHSAAYKVASNEEGKRLIDFLNSPARNAVLANNNALGIPVHLIAKLPKQILELEWDEKNWKESAKQVFGFTDEEIEIIS